MGIPTQAELEKRYPDLTDTESPIFKIANAYLTNSPEDNKEISLESFSQCLQQSESYVDEIDKALSDLV